jgi:hypothetical protein
MENQPNSFENAPKEISAILAKMTAEEIEIFGKWYVEHLKKVARDKKRQAHDSSKIKPNQEEKTLQIQQDATLKKRLGL